MQLLFSIAWRNVWRHRLRSLITAGAMAVGMAMCITLMGWVDGFNKSITEIIVERSTGHVQVHNPDYPTTREQFATVKGAADVLAKIEGVEGFKGATQRLYGFALLGGDSTSAGVQLVGMDPGREEAVTKFSRMVTQGEMLGDGAQQGILLGEGLAKTLEVGPGDEVVAMTQASDGSIGNELYTVSGLVVSGSASLDRSGAWLHLNDLQELVQMQGEVHEITAVSEGVEIADFAANVRAVAGADLLSRAWWEVSPEMFELLKTQDVMKYFILVIVFAASAFGVVNTLLMSVWERTRELGVLRAIGLKPAQLVSMILIESFFLGCLASVMGLILGGVLTGYLTVFGIQLIEDGKPLSFNGISLDSTMYADPQPIPILACVVAAFVVSFLASLWPAWRVARLDPITAIRTE